MLQAKLVAYSQFIIEEVPVPVPKGNEVLIKVEVAGICGSDLHAYHGKHPFITFPIVPGHEISGTIAKIGSETDPHQFEVGQRVTMEPSLVCGECYNCKNGRYNICDILKVIGCQSDGGYANYLAVPADKIVHLHDDISIQDGAMLEPLAVAVHAADRGLVLNEENSVLVIGAGTIGLLIAQVAKARGASVVITDIIEERLEIASRLGLMTALNKEDQLSNTTSEYAPDGYDVIFDCVGIAQTIKQAILIARKGSRIVIVGVVSSEVLLPVGIIQDRELDLLGDLMYTRKDFHHAQQLVVEKKVNLNILKSRMFPLTEVNDAFEYAVNNPKTALKVFITL